MSLSLFRLKCSAYQAMMTRCAGADTVSQSSFENNVNAIAAPVSNVGFFSCRTVSVNKKCDAQPAGM